MTMFDKRFKVLDVERNAEIIIFDESTTNINKNDFKKFKRLIEGLKNEGKTIIFISHKLDEVFEISDSLIILRNGKVIKQIGIDEASKDEVIDLFITNKKNKNIQAENNKDNLCKILIEYDKINNLNTSIDKGEIIFLESGDTSLNQELGYNIFTKLSVLKGLKIYLWPDLP